MQLASVLQPLADFPGKQKRVWRSSMASKLLAALLCAAAHALPQGGIRQALRDATLRRKTHKSNAAAERYFTQRLDHFDASLKNASFQQRYFVNSTHYNITRAVAPYSSAWAARARRSTRRW